MNAPQVMAITKRLAEAEAGGPPVVAATVVEPGMRAVERGTRLLIEVNGATIGSLGDPTLDALIAAHARDAFARHAPQTVYATADGISHRLVAAATAVYLESVGRRPVFVVVGAGHVGRAVATLASFIGDHVVVIDDREDYADPALIPAADEVICDDFEAALRRYPIGPGTSVVMVTRGHRQDEVSLRCSLGRGADYVGMIGSRRRTGAVLEHLRADGFAEEELAQVRTPIGLDIGAETPEEIAVSIIAEVVLLRRSGTGVPMYHRAGTAGAEGGLPGG